MKCTIHVTPFWWSIPRFIKYFVILIFSFADQYEAHNLLFKGATTFNRCEPLTKPNSDGWSRGCGCQYEDTGQIVSLFDLQTNYSKAGHPKEPRFQAHDSVGWFYSFNPCTDFSKFQNEVRKYPGYRPCKRVAGARWTDESTHECFGLGDQASADFVTWSQDQLDNLTTSNLTLTFRNTTTRYGMQISLVCNKSISANRTLFTYLGTRNKPDSTYLLDTADAMEYYVTLVTVHFKWTKKSVCCCPDGCDSGYPENNKISDELWYVIGIGGFILFLLLLIVLVMYILQRRSAANRYYPESDVTDPLIRNV